MDYLVYDVFTDRPFGGNPLAIIPDGPSVPDTQLQAIAREFNLSETVFLFPPDDPSHTARLRIFTPMAEVPFAGHPVIGTAVMLGEAGLGPGMVLELGVGSLVVEVDGSAAAFVITQPLERFANPDPALVARAIGVERADMVGAPVIAGIGLAFTFTEVTDRATLASLTTQIAAFHEGHARFPSELGFAQCVFCRAGGQIHMRMFAPLANVPEDPATGSAAAALGALLCADAGGPVEITIHQGEDFGRPSVIHVAARPDSVTVSGQAVRVMEGKLAL